MLALEEDEARRAAVIRVRDTGMGISPDVLPRLFQPFVQADSTLDRSRGGLGLGLALVKGIVELHGGTVEAQSAGVNEGSEFVVRLPAMADAAGKPDPGGVSEVVRTGPPKKRRVLVVDDNVDSTKCWAMLLRSEGHEVRTANDGPSAIEIASGFDPEVVLLDIGMPEMDGYETARRLRAEPSGASCLLVAVTGYGLEEDRRKSRDAGFDRHIVKPMNFEALQQIFDSLPSR
jgi:two-component system CheB/CheR fusion protein